MVLYMAVTPDKYELPLCVAESVAELGEMLGKTPKTVQEMVSKHTRKPPMHTPKLVRVVCEEQCVCPICGALFEKKDKRRKYCSVKCRNRASSKRASEKRRAKSDD